MAPQERGVDRGRRDRGQGGRPVQRRALLAAADRGVREAAPGEQPRCSRRLEEHDAAHRL